MATLTVQESKFDTPVQPNLVSAAAGGDEFDNDGSTFFRVDNGDTSGKNVTFNSQKNCNFGFDHDSGPHTVPAGETRVFGPFNTDRFNDSNGRVQVTYDDVTSVTVAVIKLGAGG